MSLSIRAKLMGILGAGILTVGLIAIVCFYLLSGRLNDFEGLLHHEVAAALSADRMTVEFKVQVQEWKNVLLRGADPANREKYWGKFEESHNKVQALGKTVLSETDDPEARKLTQQFLDSHGALLPRYKEGYQAYISSGFDHTAGDTAVKGIDREPTTLVENVTERLYTLAKEHSDKVTAASASTVKFGMLFIFISMLAAMMAGMWALKNWLITPLQNLCSNLKHLSKGELNIRIEHTADDEIGQMTNAVRSLRDTLNDSAGAIEATLRELGGAAGALVNISGKIEKGTKDQYQRTDQVATAMTQMSSAADQVAKHASNAASAAVQVDKSARTGVTTMRQAIATINATSEQIASTADVVKQLEEDTKSVGTVLDVIKGIAEQTNLLALNAAIEAARAGEQGRGFAVVADEVRTLAQRTQQSTAEIHTIIENVQNGAQNAVNAIETGKTRTGASVEQVNNAGQTIEEISSAMQHILEMNGHIAQAAHEQSSVSEDISRNVVEITSIAESSAQHARQTLEHSEKLTSMADELSKLVKRIKAS
ncbi:MAG: methyl-accepting chemotaxis protein [Oceanospirillaceae bacterium]|nr:methyl-accepting chemotaxis protein [Oceanospirillaceae bacterium]